jgi:hypothetical protein
VENAHVYLHGSLTPGLSHDDLDVSDWPVVVAVKTSRLVDGNGPGGNHGDLSSDNHHLGFLGWLGWG